MESTPLPADPLLASALVGRGDSLEERERIAALNQKRDWGGLLRYAEERQRRDPEGSDWGVIGDYPKATAALSRVIQRNPEDIGAWNLLGESQRQAGQPGQAVRTLERASAIGRTSFATFFLLGEAYRDSNRLDRAVSAYREAARLEPEFARAWFELGAAHVRLGERDEVPAVLGRLEKLDPMLAEELRKRLEARQRP
ncbi:MAG: tetratricopeptide repeat protein [Betaproteobacteria bacterium]|nr:MAG: tetratricopeptide repeat protein [Betaproteobacteria bacterium]